MYINVMDNGVMSEVLSAFFTQTEFVHYCCTDCIAGSVEEPCIRTRKKSIRKKLIIKYGYYVSIF